MQRLFTTTVLTAILLGSGATLMAADAAKEKTTAPSQVEPKTKQLPFRGKVSAVDTVAKTVTLEGKEKARTFQITSGTKINRDGNPAILNDVKVGDPVGGLARTDAQGRMEVVTLNVGTKPGKTKPRAKQKGKE